MLIKVENIKCGGCVNSIHKKLVGLDQVDDVSVDIENGLVTIESEENSENLRSNIVKTLAAMGYPEQGSVEGLSSVRAKATSFVSCAIGKMADQ